MNKNEVCKMLDILYSELVSEIDVHFAGFWDEKTAVLADAIKNAVKSTREQLYGSEEDI